MSKGTRSSPRRWIDVVLIVLAGAALLVHAFGLFIAIQGLERFLHELGPIMLFGGGAALIVIGVVASRRGRLWGLFLALISSIWLALLGLERAVSSASANSAPVTASTGSGMLLTDNDAELAEEPGAAEIGFEGGLSEHEIAAIDERLLRYSSSTRYKVAQVISDALADGGFDSWQDGCVEFHARRVLALVSAGRLEAFGNPRQPRFSEVRLPSTNEAPNQ